MRKYMCAQCYLCLQSINDPECSSCKACQFARVNLIRGGIIHVLPVMILDRIAVDLIQLVIERVSRMGLSPFAYLSHDVTKPIIGKEAARIGRAAMCSPERHASCG